jgi:uncharacterized protein YktB (UPF0637 family)
MFKNYVFIYFSPLYDSGHCGNFAKLNYKSITTTILIAFL